MANHGWLKKLAAQLRTRRSHGYSPRQRLRRRILGGFVLLLLLSVFLGWNYFTDDKRIRNHALRALENFSGGDVELEQASLDILHHVRIRGLRVYLPNSRHNDQNLVLAADDVLLLHKPLSIITRQLQLDSIVVSQGKLNIWYDHDRKLANLQLLQPPQKHAPGASLPTVFLRNSRISYTDIMGDKVNHSGEQEFSGRIFREATQNHILGFELISSDQGILRKTDIKGTFDLVSRHLQVQGQVRLELISMANLPSQLEEAGKMYTEAEPTGSLFLQAEYNRRAGIDLKLQLRDAALRLPVPNANIPLSGVDADLHLTNENIQLVNLSGHYENFCTFHLDGTIYGYKPDAAFELRARTENLLIPDESWSFIPSGTQEPSEAPADTPGMAQMYRLLPYAVQRLITQYKPTGRADMVLSLSKKEGENVPGHQELIIESHDTTVSFWQFAYPLRHLRGKIVVSPDGNTIGPFTGHDGERTYHIEGVSSDIEPSSPFRTTVTAKNISFDNDLRNALSENDQETWDKFDPQGVFDVVYHVSRDEQRQKHIEAEFELKSLSVKNDEFPIDLKNAQGKVKATPELAMFDIEQLADQQRGRIRLQGRLEQPRQPNPPFELDIEFANFYLQDELVDYLCQTTSEIKDKLELRAIADGRAHLKSLPNDETENKRQLDYQLQMQIRNGLLEYADFPYKLTHLSANLELDNQQLNIKSFEGSHNQSVITLSGQARSRQDYKINIIAMLELDNDLRGALGEKAEKYWQQYQPEGAAKIELDLQCGPDHEKMDYLARIEPLNCSATPLFGGSRLENINGQMTARPGEFKFEPLTAGKEPTHIELSGTLKQNKNSPEANLKLISRALEITTEQQQALPGKLGRRCREYNFTGTIATDLNIKSQPDTNNSWQAEGRIDFHNVSFDKRINGEMVTGGITGEGTYDPTTKQFNFEGNLESTDMMGQGRPLSNLTARIKVDGKNNLLQLNEIKGVFCDGQLAGRFTSSTSQQERQYDLNLAVRQGELLQLIVTDPQKINKGPTITGKFDSSISLCKPDPNTPQRGRAMLRVTDTVLGDLPILAQVLQVLNFSLPSSGVFRDMAVSASIADKTTWFENIRLNGDALSLQGSGSMQGVGQDINIILAARKPQQLPSLPFVTSFYESVLTPALMHVQISGSYKDPKVQTVVLPGLDSGRHGLDKTH